MILIFCCCKKAYNPSIISSPNRYLVVEGVVNSGNDSTFIKLSRTVKLSGNVATNPELNATVTVESDQNASYPLTETGNGNYSCSGLHLDNSRKYRLRIKTANSEQYLSDYVPIVNSPPIDSISYDTKGTVSGPGLNIYANTHDQIDKARYYRWEYGETWIIHANYDSNYKSNGDTVLSRDLVNDDIYTCWQNDTSHNIILGSSAKLTQNLISNSPIVSIASTAEKLGDEYSILVTQYALTADAYNFYVNLKKNTEQLGSIFDAQPSEISGNIHSVSNPAEPVIGYVTIGTKSSQRIFIKKEQLPVPWVYPLFYSDCQIATDVAHKLPCCYYSIEVDGQLVNQVNEFINYNRDGGYDNALIPLSTLALPGHPPAGYTATIRECADCTLRGTNKKPSFWK